MKTNLDWLHKVAAGETGGRRSGRTFYQCHLVAGAAEVGNKRIVIVMPNNKWQKHISPMLETVFRDHGLKVVNKKTRKEWTLSNGSRIIFETSQKNLYGYDKENTAFVTFN